MQLSAARFTAALMALVGVVPGGIAGPKCEASELRVPDGTPIIVVSVDTLRSDRLPAYGYSGVATPAIDGLRRDGILFERAYTNVPLTLPAHTSLFTGLLPPDHGVRDNLGYSVDTARGTLLQQLLKARGYATGAGVSAYVLRGSTGIAAGFDFYQDDIDVSTGPGLQSIQRPGRETLDAVRPWLRSAAGQPFYLFFHIFEPHTPYEPPAAFASRYPSPYDGEVATADEVVGGLLDELRALGVYTRALIVLLSDHGEGLGEHGEDEHGLFLYRSTLQVPLIVKLPGQQRAGDSVDYPVQLIDVVPFLLSALGQPVPENLPGVPLLHLPRPNPGDPPIYAETFFPRLHFGWSDLASVIVDQHHFIDAPRPELYDLARDPAEVHDMVDRDPALGAGLRAALASYDRRLVSPDHVDSETLRQLEALGYVGRASTDAGDVLPDPKDRVGALADIRRAYQLYADGDLEAAEKSYRTIVKDNPRIETAWEYLALAQIRRGRLEEAVATSTRAVELMPKSGRLALRAAALLQHMGRLDEAFVYANTAIVYDPSAAHLLLARIALAQGDLESAESEARQAMSDGARTSEARQVLADVFIARGEPAQAIDLLVRLLDEDAGSEPVAAKLAITYVWVGNLDMAEAVLEGFEASEDLAVLMAFGKLAISRQRWSEASTWFDRALAIDPDNPTVKLNLGLIATAEGRLPDAAEWLEQATDGNPGSFEAFNALGEVCARQGDMDGAIRAWDRALEIDPDAVSVVFNLGLAHAQAGHFARAADLMETVAAVADGEQKERALAMARRMRQRTAPR